MTEEQVQHDPDETETEAETDAEAETEAETEKRDKPKKIKINYEASMPRNEAVSYFEAIVGGLRSGRLEFKQDEQTLVLRPPDRLEIEVKAQRKGDKGKVVFSIEWTDDGPGLEISS